MWCLLMLIILLVSGQIWQFDTKRKILVHRSGPDIVSYHFMSTLALDEYDKMTLYPKRPSQDHF